MAVAIARGPRVGFIVALSVLAWGALGFDALLADGLKSAGLTGTPPPNAGAFEKFVDQMAENFIWVLGTMSVLAIVVVAGLFFFGHTRAQDIAMKIALGVGLVILAPGIAA